MVWFVVAVVLHVGVLGFDRYVRYRVAGRGRQLASLIICHKKQANTNYALAA